MKTRFVGRGRALVLAVVVLVGCGGDDESSSESDQAADQAAEVDGGVSGSAASASSASAADQQVAPGDPCALLDIAAADAFFGAPTSVQFSDATGCRMAAGSASLWVSLFAPQSRDDYDGARSTRPDALDIPGIGEVADYSPALTTLQFLQDDTIVSIQVVGSQADAAQLQEFVVGQATYAAGVL